MIRMFLDHDTDVIKSIENAGTKINFALQGTLSQEAATVADRIRSNASGAVVQGHTGTLADSVVVQPVESDGAKTKIEIKAAEGDAFYGKILERGTKAFEEHPRFRVAQKAVKSGGKTVKRAVRARAGAHAMKFLAGGGTVFAKLVRHPPVPKFAWFSGVLDTLTPRIVEDVAKSVDEALDRTLSI